ncbi:MAG: site-specific integrase [Deltaproteobacteria bacterium]|nr:site-specific integrase [Deltaproteobacteria bacterium]
MRDRALLSLILQSKLKIGELTNLTVARFNKIVKREKRKQKGALSAEALQPVEQYLEQSGLSSHKKLALFPHINRKGKITGRALCAAQVKRIVKRAAKRAGSKVKFNG